MEKRIRLLVSAPVAEAATTGMRFQPTYPQTLDPGPSWPRCRHCHVAMNYLGRLPVPDSHDQSVLFQCCANPGSCMDWEADGGGTPHWVQGIDQTPDCRRYGQPMRFIAQLEEGVSRFNFAGGCAHVFDCHCHCHAPGQATWFWQC
ncbi:MAG: hypothetical protein Q4G62_06425 [Pseudomonadota bacterium]|nr:hypothetical protein [Pseudomonadota bacterium]